MSNLPRVGNRKGQREQAAERRVQALELRKAGATYRQIGAQLHVSECQAHRDVQRALTRLAALEAANADDLRQLELERLDGMLLAIAPQMKAGHLGAIDRGLRISESRRKLLGLDAPAKTDLTSGGQAVTFRVIYGDDGTTDPPAEAAPQAGGIPGQ